MEDSPRRHGAHGEEGTPGFSPYSRCLIGVLAGPRRIRRSAENLPGPRKKTESMIGRKRTPSRCSLGFVRWPPAVHRGRPHRRGLPRRSPGSRPGRQTLSPGYAPCDTRPAGRPRHPQTPTSRLPCDFRRILSVVSEKVHDLLLESASRAVESGQAFTLIPPPHCPASMGLLCFCRRAMIAESEGVLLALRTANTTCEIQKQPIP